MKKENEIDMKYTDFVKEHKKLIPLLEGGSLSARKKEAKKQKAELTRTIKKHNG